MAMVSKDKLNVKTLLETGFLEGQPIKYKKGQAELNGFISGLGYLCGCSACNFSKVLSALKFESHAGAISSNQNNYIFLSYGISVYALVKKLDTTPVHSLRHAIDGYLKHSERGSGSKFKTITHKKYKPKKCVLNLPSEVGSCFICKDNSFKTGEEFTPRSFIFCGQCERLYHAGCVSNLQERPNPWRTWLCSEECKEVNLQLKHFVRSSPHGSGVLKWALLSGVYSDRTRENEGMFLKARSILRDAFGEVKADGNDILAAMVEGGEEWRLQLGGMHCVVMTSNSEVVACGVVRVFGREFAEFVLVATDKECSGDEYFGRIVGRVEKLMMRMKVKNLVVCVDEEEERVWKDIFGYDRMSEEKEMMYVEDYWMIRFEKWVMLEKALIPFGYV